MYTKLSLLLLLKFWNLKKQYNQTIILEILIASEILGHQTKGGEKKETGDI